MEQTRDGTYLLYRNLNSEADPSKVVFEEPGYQPGGSPLTRVVMPAWRWSEFGKPRTITVAIASGDLLNIPANRRYPD